MCTKAKQQNKKIERFNGEPKLRIRVFPSTQQFSLIFNALPRKTDEENYNN